MPGLMKRLQKKASRLSLFDALDTDCNTTPTPFTEPAQDCSSPTSPSTTVPAHLQPVEYLAPRRRASSLGFDNLVRRMSTFIPSPAPADTPLPGCPGNPKLGPGGVLVTSSFFDEQGYPVDSSVRRGRNTRHRPMSTCHLPSLPPGAAEPVLGGIDFGFDFMELLDDETLFRPPSRKHTRSTSMSAADALTFDTPREPAPEFATRPETFFGHIGAGHHTRSLSPGPNFTMASPGAPVVPPRSRLRGPAVIDTATSTPSMCSSATTSEDHSSLPSGRTSPTRRPYVLDVAAPVARPEYTTSPVEFNDDVITFGRTNRKSRDVAHIVSASKDPFKVRDGASAQNSRSGVYTPRTFPGPAPKRENLAPIETTPRSVSNPTRSAATPSYVRARTLSGFKRLSMALGNSHSSSSHISHGHAYHPSISSPLPTVSTAMPSRSAYPIPPIPARPTNGHTHLRHGSMASHASHASHESASSRTSPRASYSPSSANSAASISPPGTPTTPTSTNHGYGFSSPSRPVVIVPADQAPDYMHSRDLDLELTPKASPATSPLTLPRMSFTPVQLSPTAPKRARRKPVPRLEDDIVKQLETEA